MRYKLCRCGGVRQDCKGGSCARCGAGKVNKRRSTAEHGYDNAWNRLSVRKRTHHPLCEKCLGRGIVAPATEVHHIIPIDHAPWLRLDWSNLVSLCNACHVEEHRLMAVAMAAGGS